MSISILLGALLIFLMRACDVSLGTIRVIMAFQGRSLIAATIGFFEVTIFILAMGKVMSSLDSPINVIAYSSGFATGTLLGIWIEGRIALGIRFARIITHRQNDRLVDELRGQGFGITRLNGEGLNGRVYVLISVVKRKDLAKFMATVKKYAPSAFVSVEDTRLAEGGYLGHRKLK
jgi:uncharacterized protein YebE (UPF0316 family)